MISKLSLLIVDDHKIFRDGLRQLLDHFEYVEQIEEASNGAECLNLLGQKSFDIVFMDIEMPVLNGIETTQKALVKYPDLKIIVLTTFHDEEYLDQMMLAGVHGYMLKRSSISDFDTAMQRVMEGGNYFSDEIVHMLTQNLNKRRTSDQNLKLNDREKEILQLICKGYNNDQIAQEIHLSPKTVEKHKSSLFVKTDTKNTVNLIIFALKKGLVNIDEIPG